MTTPLTTIVRLALEPTTDGVLLERYRHGDQTALATIVRRHSPTVYGVCQRVFGPTPDADDAFQATFLTLMQQARHIRQPESLGSWLHGVALRCSRKLLRQRGHVVTETTPTLDEHDPYAAAAWQEVRSLLDDELQRLPAKLRAPLVLCHLEYKTRDEAAQQLGWPLRTFDRRLAQGRKLLQARLTRRGLANVGLGAALLGSGAMAQVPERLSQAILQGNASKAAHALLAPATSKLVLQLLLVGVVVLGSLAGVIGLSTSTPTEKPPEPKTTITAPDENEPPLPDGALQRLGSMRYRFPGSVAHATLSPDGKHLAIGGYDLVIVYDAATGQHVHTFRHCGMTNAVGRLPAMAFSPDGQRFAHLVGHGEITARVWDMATGKQIATTKGGQPPFRTGLIRPGDMQEDFDWFSGLHFADDGKQVAIVGSKHTRYCHATTGELVKKEPNPVPLAPEGKDIPNELVAFSDGGRFLIHTHGPWYVHDMQTGKRVWEKNIPYTHTRNSPYPCAALSTDGRYAAIPTAAFDGLELWDIKEDNRVRTFTGPDIKIRDHVSFSRDGQQLLAAGKNCVYRWEVTSGKMLPTLRNESGWDHPRAFTNTKGDLLITLNNDAVIRHWDRTTGQERPTPHGYIGYTITSLAPNGQYAAVGDPSGQVDWWNLTTKERVGVLAASRVRVSQLLVSPTSKYLAIGDYDGTIRVWDMSVRKEIRTLRMSTKSNESELTGLAWAPDEATLFATSAERGLVAWDWRAAIERWTADTRNDQPKTKQGTKLALRRDGKTLAVLRSNEYEIQLRDTTTGQLQRTLTKPSTITGDYSSPQAIIFHPDGHTLLVAHYDGHVRLWDTTTGKLQAAFRSTTKQPDGTLWAIDVSADGRYAVTGSYNGYLRIWELANQTEVLQRQTDSSITHVTFAPDMRCVLAAHSRAAHVWSTKNTTRGTPDDQWSKLDAEPHAAYQAMWSLAESPNAAAFVQQKIGPAVPPSEAKRITELIADLNDDQFRKREAASYELVRLGRVAEEQVRATLRTGTPAEQKQRLEKLIERYDAGISADDWRIRRAIQVLQWTRDPDAKKVLMEYAAGMQGAPLTEAAKLALAQRLASK